MNGGKILAPSNTGFVQREIFLHGTRYVKPSLSPTPMTANPTILMSFKSTLVKSDRKAPTDYTRMISKLQPLGHARYENRGYVVEWDNSYISLSAYPNGCSIPSGDVSVPSYMVDQVIMDAKAEMNDFGANVLEDLGQLKSTGVMIAEVVMVIFELYKACLKGNFGAVRRRLRNLGSNVPRSIANGWLMYFYGIKPLVSTIDALAANQEPLDTKKTVRKRREIAGDISQYVYNGRSYQCNGRAKIQAQCQISAHVRVDGNTRYWNSLGLTSSSMTDAVVTAWALVPYSFVFDWFLPVEAYLRSLVWSPHLVYQGGFVGRRHEASGQFTDLNTGSPYGPYSGSFPRSRLQAKFYKRTAYVYTVPSAVLALRLNLNSNQIISAAALIISKG